MHTHKQARKEHVECVVAMKKFWQCVYSSKKKGGMLAVIYTAQVLNKSLYLFRVFSVLVFA